MMGDNKSEKFFKVLHDRMKEAQSDIKATVSVNVGEMTHNNTDKVETGEMLECLVFIDHLNTVQSEHVINNLTALLIVW